LPLRLLLVEDSEDDAMLLVQELRKGGFDPDFTRVDTPQALELALDENAWDAVIADYNLPAFTGLDALRIIQATGLDLPFILVSGIIGEEMAVKAMKAGAHDFILKGNYSRLAPALERELQEAVVRRERRQVQEELQRAHDELEMHVLRRTAELDVINEELRAEIAERELAEEELRQVLHQTESILAGVSDLHFVLDRQWRYLYVNKTAADVIGRPVEEILGRLQWELFPDIMGTELDRQFHLAMDKRMPVQFEFYYPTTDSWWDNRFNPSPEGLAVYATDITQRKKAEEALQESENRFRNYFELGLVGAAITLPGNGFIAVNDKLCEIFGYERSELMQLTWLDLLHPNNPAADVAKYERVLAGEIAAITLENCFVRKDGRVIYANLSARCLHREDGSPECCVMHVQDVTGRKQTEKEIIAYQEQLRSMTTEIAFVEERSRRKIAIALHDQVGQTLAMAALKLGEVQQAVGSGNLGGQVKEIREMISHAIRHSRTLTFELSPPILYELGLEAAFSSLAERYQKEHGIRIDFSDDHQPKPLSDDMRILLFQGVRELLVNAVKHAHARRITIFCQRKGADIRVMVEDDGGGFDTAAGENRTRKDHGFGLFSLRERLNFLGGSIAIQSTPPRGTQITLTAPLLS